MSATWAVTYAGTCPSCGTHCTLSASAIPDEHRPEATKFDEPMDDYRCFCDEPMSLPVVGITRDPYVVKRDEDDDDFDESADRYDYRDAEADS